ncbi:MAG: glycosyltransferase family 4 protein [Verrucomicrobia bacterium]|nr:glycosyltransferase family 4 protein [Verrucomicrobiota bacterium]
MRIVQITPGAGSMYCGNCLRDNALVGAWLKAGHDVLMLPMYLPLTLDELNHSAGAPIFFSGLNVYLEQKSAFFRAAPNWLHRLLASPRLLAWTRRFAARTRPADVADLMLSMLRGESGNQARELEELLQWLERQPKPDVLCLSNALLLGLARRLKAGLGARVVCLLSGEDTYLDGLPEPQRTQAWQLLAERARQADLFIAPSHYFADRMRDRLHLAPDRVRTVPTGLNLAGYETAPSVRGTSAPARPPVVGYFARMCRDKGLETLVEAFLELKSRGRVPGVRLKVGGSCGPADEPFVAALRQRLRARQALDDVEFHPNLDRTEKIAFLKSLSLFSVPALYGEAFGLYLLEAMAAGVPVVQPRHAAFPELVADTGGGVLYDPDQPAGLVEALEALLLDPARLRQLGEAGQRAVGDRYSADAVARLMSSAFGLAESIPRKP